MLARIVQFGRMIRFSHTIFAMPFALAGAAAAARFAPLTWQRVLWIVVAMVGARSAAMGFNRLVDRSIDAANPRTQARELPAGVISVGATRALIAVSAAVFVVAAAQLGRWPLMLSPVALAIVFFYSYTKRFTWASHLFLGLALASAPLGAWIAVTGSLAWPPVILGLAVLTWVAGFDTIYSCQDLDFDRRQGLHSVPARFGVAGALRLTRVLHAVTVICLVEFGRQLELGWIYHVGVAVVAVTLLYENSLVKADDLSRVDKAFFDLNGIISFVYLVAVLAARPWIS